MTLKISMQEVNNAVFYGELVFVNFKVTVDPNQTPDGDNFWLTAWATFPHPSLDDFMSGLKCEVRYGAGGSLRAVYDYYGPGDNYMSVEDEKALWKET